MPDAVRRIVLGRDRNPSGPSRTAPVLLLLIACLAGVMFLSGCVTTDTPPVFKEDPRGTVSVSATVTAGSDGFIDEYGVYYSTVFDDVVAISGSPTMSLVPTSGPFVRPSVKSASVGTTGQAVSSGQSTGLTVQVPGLAGSTTYHFRMYTRGRNGSGTVVGYALSVGTYTTLPAVQSIASAVVQPIPQQVFTGAEVKPTLVVTVGATLLQAGVDYSATYLNNVNVGVATAVITGMGNYSGTATAPFQIVGKSILTATRSSIPVQTYTGGAIRPEIVLTQGSTVLTECVDYTICYSSNRNPGMATMVVSGIGQYGGTFTVTFDIIPRAIQISSVTPGKGRATVRWAKTSGNVSGYQLAYRRVGTTPWKTVYVSGTSKTVFNLLRNKKYSFKVRAYKLFGTTKRFGAYGSIKTVAIK